MIENKSMQITLKTSFEIERWSNGSVFASPILEKTEENPSGIYWQIKTTNGVMTAITGDYIIKGVNGWYSPCKIMETFNDNK